jgi:hypothetical protein
MNFPWSAIDWKSSVCVPSAARVDGVAKTHQLLRCCNCSRHCGVPKYTSFLDNCAPCIWRFLLSHSLFGFLAKASKVGFFPEAEAGFSGEFRISD